MDITMHLLDDVWNVLWIISEEKRTITCSELRTRLYKRGYILRSHFLTPTLVKISKRCIENRVPMLTALVVDDHKGTPSESYFSIQRANRDSGLDDIRTWEAECKAVWREWA